MNVKIGSSKFWVNPWYQALATFGSAKATSTATFYKMFNQFFDCLNIRNTQVDVKKGKPFLKPYSSPNNKKFKKG